MKATVLHSVVSGSKTSYMKFEEGDNKIRVVSVPVRHDTYKMPDGKKFFIKESVPASVEAKATKTFFLWVIDRKESTIKLLECGSTINAALEALSENPDYKFDTIPPYDITVSRKGKGTDTQYTLTPGRNDIALTPEEQEAVAALEPLEAYIDRKKEWELRALNNAPAPEKAVIETAEGEVLPF